jgi:transmembrane sensor
MDANERRERAAADAVRWWAQLGNKPPAQISEADRREFTTWLRESPVHVAEFLHIAHVDDTLRSFQLWDEIPCGTEFDDVKVVVLAPPCASEATQAARPTGGVRLRWRFAIAASVVAVAVLAAWFGLHAGATVLSTDRAELREVMLADGSTVNLGPETKLRVSLSKSERRITLEHGRALFRVAKDSHRPFLVASAGTLVRAVGTIFGVEESEDTVVVTVKEGKVAVRPATPARTAPYLWQTHSENIESGQPGASSSANLPQTLLTSNEQITLSTAGGVRGPVREVDASRALAWSEGVLVFNSTPLEEVVRVFNQYNRVQIRIRDVDLGRRTVSGVFQASDTQTLVDFIRAGARVTVTRTSGGEIQVSPVPTAEVAPRP